MSHIGGHVAHGWTAAQNSRAMGLFRKLFRGEELPPVQPDALGKDRSSRIEDGMEVQLLEGETGLNVVGESHYQENIRQAIGARNVADERVRVDVQAVLVAETDNPYDVHAISVWVNGFKVGHFSREDAQRYREGLLELERRSGRSVALRGVIAGGGMREDGPGRLGVFLRHNSSDFGLRDPGPRPNPQVRVRTGLTEAIATDGADDAYDLGWAANLPEDPIQAISTLRGLLENERDPIDRHFMFHHLEEALYRSRDSFASALNEYDKCCRQHDSEMQDITAAFIAKWGSIPWLHTYKQMCIRLAKAKNFEEALRWAERGLAIYGQDAARPDAVEDLRKRAETYRARLTQSH